MRACRLMPSFCALATCSLPSCNAFVRQPILVPSNAPTLMGDLHFLCFLTLPLFRHHFPFIDEPLRLRTANRLWCDSLHEGVVWPTNHRML